MIKWLAGLSNMQKILGMFAAIIISSGVIITFVNITITQAQVAACAAVRPMVIKTADSIFVARIIPLEAKMDTLIKEKKSKDSLVVGMWYLLHKMATSDEIIDAKNEQTKIENCPKVR